MLASRSNSAQTIYIFIKKTLKFCCYIPFFENASSVSTLLPRQRTISCSHPFSLSLCKEKIFYYEYTDADEFNDSRYLDVIEIYFLIKGKCVIFVVAHMVKREY